METNNKGRDRCSRCCSWIKNRNFIEMIGIFSCEILGTGILVFLGCLGSAEGVAIGSNIISSALSFGIAALIGTQIFFQGSGGHLNPSLTLASLFFRNMKVYTALLYCISQCIGALIGFGMLKLILPKDRLYNGSHAQHGLCTTVPKPNTSLTIMISMEFIMTTMLVLVVCSLWDLRNRKHDHSNIKYFLTMFFLIYVGESFSGCSLNPARSLAPAIWNNYWDNQWVYLVVPISSGIFGGFFYTTYYGPDCYTRLNANIPLSTG